MHQMTGHMSRLLIVMLILTPSKVKCEQVSIEINTNNIIYRVREFTIHKRAITNSSVIENEI